MVLTEAKTNEVLDNCGTLEVDSCIYHTPTTNEEFAQIIRAEANYDRWSNLIFPHPKSKNLRDRRKHVRIITLQNSETIEASIEVIPAKDERAYTSRSYDVFLAIIEIWREQGMTADVMNIYVSDIAKQLELQASGQNLNLILTELNALYFTSVTWNFSFQNSKIKTDSVKNMRLLDTFNYQTVKQRKKGTGSNTKKCEIRLSEQIRNNLKNKISIPVNFSARKSINSEISKTIYNRVDNIIAKSGHYERTAINIIHDYNIAPERYKYKSQRKELLNRIVKNLDGIETSRKGVFIQVQIKETSNSKDYKLIFNTNGKIKTTKRHNLPILNNDEAVIEYLIHYIDEVVGGLNENYGLYKTFAQHYSETHIHRAISEFKEYLNTELKIENKQSFFTSIMHRIAHEYGKEWIKPCKNSCKYHTDKST